MISSNSKRMELLDLLDKISFALDDTRLFLDTHPTNKEALSFFDTLQKKRKMIIKEYTMNFGPICAYDVELCDYWKWNTGPMPWQANYREGGR